MTPPTTIAFLPGSAGGPELLIVLTLILMLFGAKRVPDIARRIGSVLSDLRRASDDFREQLMRETDLDDDKDSHKMTPRAATTLPAEPEKPEDDAPSTDDAPSPDDDSERDA
jgi:sec-independent protein translocase protein TatA